MLGLLAATSITVLAGWLVSLDAREFPLLFRRIAVSLFVPNGVGLFLLTMRDVRMTSLSYATAGAFHSTFVPPAAVLLMASYYNLEATFSQLASILR